MEVILLDDVDKLGLRGEVVNVARGYARNFLLPRRLAEAATPAKVAELRKREEQRARHEARSTDQATEIAGVLAKTVLRFEVKAGPTGSLFGSVTPTNIADELWRTKKIRVDRRKIEIDTIKRIGRYDVPIELFQDVHASVQTHVIPEGGELPSDEELAAMEAQERGEEETTAAADTAEPTLEEVLAEEDAAEAEAGASEATAEAAVETEAAAESAAGAEPTAEAEEEPEAPAEPEAVAETEPPTEPEAPAEPASTEEPA